ncbi:MAG TPA: hypothetical protein HA348_06875 [Thermoplasmata archaeon]|nr:hypothetical protein [Thermoplasmata archaeon]
MNVTANNYNDPILSMSIIIRKIILRGHVALLFKELRKRLYSNNQYYIFRRDVTLPFTSQETKCSLILRQLCEEDIPRLLNLDQPQLPDNEVLERIRRLRLLKSGIQTCYVAVTHNDIPVAMCWLIDASQNEKLQTFFNDGIPPLADDEILLEGGYTIESYRGLGIQRWRVCELLRKAGQCKARWVFAYFRPTITATFQSLIRNGFEPYMIRNDKWRLFKRHLIYKPLSAENLGPINHIKN